jgi:SAM-dependent methyltransferase
VSDVWDDIDKINPAGNERLGYPTQKPLALLERIIDASSNRGEIVLDPFCGCGTAIHAAERLGRQWIGIDITYPAIQVIEDRVKKWLPGAKYEVAGIPYDEHSARKLAEMDPFTFQQWAVGRLGGQSRGRGADKGIDGQINFAVGQDEYWRAIVSVKAGRNVNPDMVRALKGVVEREGAQMGVFVCLDASREMRAEAAASDIVELPTGPRPKVQIVTVADLIANADIGIRAKLSAITSAEVARAASRKKPPKRPTAESLRTAPRLPPMGIAGGGRRPQPPLPLDEPVLAQVAERTTPFRRRRK